MWTHFVQSAHSLVCFHQTSMVAQMVKRLCTTQETQVWFLGWEDPLVNYKLALTKIIANNWTTKTFAICLYGGWTPCSYSCWLSTTPEGVQGGVRHSVLQGIWWDRSLDSWMFSGMGFMISILTSLIQRSTKFPHSDIRSSWLTKNLL